MKKLLSLVICLAMLLALASCAAPASADDIVILFTNDIHCAVEDGITLSGVVYYKNLMKQTNKYVALVDCGDAIQGSYLGSVSKGEILVDAMNAAGYDYAILGNHEFDVGISRLNELMAKADAQYLCCNIKYSGSNDGIVGTKPYAIAEYGNKKVAFVGVTTPNTMLDSDPHCFMEDDVTVYDFSDGDFYGTVQQTVDDARQNGADYVIVLAHLGMEDEVKYRSVDLAANTNGIDAILDGHSHDEFIYLNTQNKDGKSIIVAQTGTKLQSLGQLVITAGGNIAVTTISDITAKDAEFDAKLQTLTAEYTEMLSKVICSNCNGLSDKDANGIRAVRNRETALGNLVADAMRYVSGADLAYQNGGGLKSGLPAGDVDYSDLIAVLPYGNTVAVVEVTGQEIADMLEYYGRNAQPETVDLVNKTAIGEEGSYPNVSGITFTIDTTVESSVIVDDDDMLVGVGDVRRISNIKIGGEDIDYAKTYTLAGSGYMINNGGSGMLHFLADHNVVNPGIMTEYEALAEYITNALGGDLSGYTGAEGRITFIGR